MRFHRAGAALSRGHKTHRIDMMFSSTKRSREKICRTPHEAQFEQRRHRKPGGSSFSISMNCNAELRRWLGGLDSNQDNQIQNLMYCQLYDLPSGRHKNRAANTALHTTLLTNATFVNRPRNLTEAIHRLTRAGGPPNYCFA